MKSLQRQQGLSLAGVGLLVFLVIFFGLIIVKMSGAYSDHYTVTKMIETALEGQTPARFSATEFKDRIKKNLEINQVQLDVKDSLKVSKRTNPLLITLSYEKRVHFFANVDVVMIFHEEYEL